MVAAVATGSATISAKEAAHPKANELIFMFMWLFV